MPSPETPPPDTPEPWFTQSDVDLLVSLGEYLLATGHRADSVGKLDHLAQRLRALLPP